MFATSPVYMVASAPALRACGPSSSSARPAARNQPGIELLNSFECVQSSVGPVVTTPLCIFALLMCEITCPFFADSTTSLPIVDLTNRPLLFPHLILAYDFCTRALRNQTLDIRLSTLVSLSVESALQQVVSLAAREAPATHRAACLSMVRRRLNLSAAALADRCHQIGIPVRLKQIPRHHVPRYCEQASVWLRQQSHSGQTQPRSTSEERCSDSAGDCGGDSLGRRRIYQRRQAG